MAIQVSPGIVANEVDLTTTIPAMSTTEGAIAGVFNWGPIGKYTLVDSEISLAKAYGTPNDGNYETFFAGANFLGYGNALYVSRAAVTTGKSVTFSTTLSGNTTLTTSNTATTVVPGMAVYGNGIEPNTTVTNVTANSSVSTIILSNAASATGTENINFFEADYSFNAIANSTNVVDRAKNIIRNADEIEDFDGSPGVEFVAKYPGEFGNSLRVSVCGSDQQFASFVNPYALVVNSSVQTNTSVIPSKAGISIEVNATTANVFIANSATLPFSDTYIVAGEIKSSISTGDYIVVGNNTIGRQSLKVKSVSALANTNPLSPTGEIYFNIEFDQPYKLSTAFSSNLINRTWEFNNVLATAPGTSDEVINAGSNVCDQISVVVVDEKGAFSGTPGTILEAYSNLSRVPNAKTPDGESNYFKSVINNRSPYIWAVNDLPDMPSANASTVANVTTDAPYSKSFVGGTTGSTESSISMGELAAAYDLFKDDTSVDVSLIITGKAIGFDGAQSVNYLVDNVSEIRKDCVVFASPPRNAVVNNKGNEAQDIKIWRGNLRASSYLFLDSGYKYQYDKYNDVYRWVPLNGDIAGLTARTDDTNDPWFSPAGFNRGQIKNIIKLSWNPNQADRDILYKDDINPVVTFPGSGTVLYGDKTALGKASAFSRIGVRRLFIILRKTISRAGRNMLFEFNDDFTRSQFKNLVEPYLRDVMGRRGITDFLVVCDETNNTQEVIDSNRFIGDIYVRPNRSINFITLNFVSVRSGQEFTEVVGQF